jgi:hypothetical protein
MSVNEPVLVGTLVANQVPGPLITGVVAALNEDFTHSKAVAALMEQVMVNPTETDLVNSLMLQIKEVPTLPPGLLALFDWVQTPAVTPVQFEEVLNAVEVAIVDNEHWWTRIDPLA